ncbi:membrane protein [Parapedobacter defluvii]|uniref:Membrane protein n=2 Tax=Parapedobacter defluvii TaxID=2045106 RepID=A0ABQ1L836_9SPHI|nr:membrane protein [Parapedobacter defluvii]
MNMMKKETVLSLAALLVCTACGRNFLDIKPDVRLTVPNTVQDYDALLNHIRMNTAASVELGIIGSDEYYIPDGTLTTLSGADERNAYIWATEIFEGDESADWNRAYERILYANMALEVEKITPADKEIALWKNVKGSALFFRALNYYQLAQLFCQIYDAATAASVPGIPLRLEYDVTQRVGRGTLAQTYRRILDDATAAVELLPEMAVDKKRPNKAAGHALLSRIYLQMADYGLAEKHASLSLQLQDDLIDLNTLDPTLNYPFPEDVNQNIEVLFDNGGGAATIVGLARFNADTTLLALYSDRDLRRDVYYFAHTNGATIFGGGYVRSTRTWIGLATDEMWITRAECRARLGDVQGALEDLNHLLRYRFRDGMFDPIKESNAEEVLRIVLQERRKELVMRGTRWEDLRRLSNDPRFAGTLVRMIDGQRYELPAGDPRWVWPIPDNEVELNKLEQNIR